MKKEIMKIPLFGIVAKASGAMPVDRKDRNSRANILKMSFKKRMLDSFLFNTIQKEQEARTQNLSHTKM